MNTRHSRPSPSLIARRNQDPFSRFPFNVTPHIRTPDSMKTITNPIRTGLTRRLSSGSLACLVLASLPVALFGAEAATGEIVGRVLNRGTGVYLEGADVALPAASLRTTTARDGAFRLSGIPAGRHDLQVFYTGLNRRTLPVTVVAGGTAQVDVDLSSEIYQLEAFTVQGEREGNAASITRQRNADNVVNVVATDALLNVADGNIGSFMQRLPGVAAFAQEDEINSVSIRGAPPAWSSVNIDGVRASAAYGGSDTTQGRAVEIGQMPAEFIKEVEIVKSLSPDVPADSIGGSANIVTKSALDVKGSVLTYRAAGNFNTFRDGRAQWTPTGAFTYLTKLGPESRWGIALSGTYSQTNNFRDRIEMNRPQADGRNTQLRTLDDDYRRIRSGGGLKVDFRPRRGLDLWAGLLYSYYSTSQYRTDWNITANAALADYARVSRAQIEAGIQPRTDANAVAGIAPGFTDTFTEMLHATFANNESKITQNVRGYKVDAGGRAEFGGGQKLEARASYHPSRYKFRNDVMTATRTGGFGLTVDTSADPQRPVIRQTYGPTIGAGSDLTASTAQRRFPNDRYSEEEMTHAGLDWQKQWAARWPLLLKAGVSWREQYHTIEVYQPSWNYVGPDGVAGRNAATGQNDDNLAQFLRGEPGYGVFNHLYPRRDQFDFPRFLAAFRQNPGWFREVGATVASAPTFNDITEDVTAGYAMARVRFGPLGVMGGVRREETEIVASGLVTDPRNASVRRAARTGSYARNFPSVHLRYAARRDLIFRAAYSTGIARPNYEALYPNTTVSYNDTTGVNTVRSNDPALGPQFSQSYDLSAEYYFEPIGVLSAGWFRKELANFIATETREVGDGPGNGFGGLYEGYNWVTSRNFGSATIEGFELNYSQVVRGWPKPFGRLSVFANYTRLRTAGEYGAGVAELALFVPTTANAGVTWNFGRFEARIAGHRNGGFLRAYNANPVVRQRNSAVDTWDVNTQFTVNPRLRLFADVRNVFNDWSYWFTNGDLRRVKQSEVFGTRISAGVSGRF